MIKTSDMFLRSEGQQLDFSSGALDIIEMFNGSVNTINKLLIDTGVDEDPILEDIKNNASDAQEDKLDSRRFLDTKDKSDSAQFGFEVKRNKIDPIQTN